jgi:hypothetical protein
MSAVEEEAAIHEDASAIDLSESADVTTTNYK